MDGGSGGGAVPRCLADLRVEYRYGDLREAIIEQLAGAHATVDWLNGRLRELEDEARQAGADLLVGSVPIRDVNGAHSKLRRDWIERREDLARACERRDVLAVLLAVAKDRPQDRVALDYASIRWLGLVDTVHRPAELAVGDSPKKS